MDTLGEFYEGLNDVQRRQLSSHIQTATRAFEALPPLSAARSSGANVRNIVGQHASTTRTLIDALVKDSLLNEEMAAKLIDAVQRAVELQQSSAARNNRER